MPAIEGVKERPILYSAPMVKALLSGAKTQTRRVVRAPIDFVGPGGCNGPYRDDPTCWGYADEYGDYHTLMPDGESSCDNSCCIPCPHGRPGERLWVRESWQKSGLGWGNDLPVGKIHYRATDDGEWKPYWGKWKPSIHMPRWASRLVLEITEVRVERIQSISDADILAEGIAEYAAALKLQGGPRLAWIHLWEAINGKRDGGRYGWHRNPWAWALTFRVLDREQDAHAFAR